MLLDTHALLWWWSDDRRLPPAARAAIEETGALVHVSVATIWEIAIKRGLGKLVLDERLVADLRSGAALDPLHELPITREHAVEAGSMAIAHKDPFDCILIAQAQLEGLSFVSNERLFDRFGINRIWD